MAAIINRLGELQNLCNARWADVVRDWDNPVQMEVSIHGNGYVFRGPSSGVAGKVFEVCGVALQPVLRLC
ncbi:MAG: hypothetical protein ACP5FH_06290 [Terracidiphilus sp.]